MDRIAEQNRIENAFLKRKRKIEIEEMELNLKKRKYEFELMKKTHE